MRPKAKGVPEVCLSLDVYTREKGEESCSLGESFACLTFHFPLESALSVVSKRKVEINTMAHKLRQIEILRKTDPPYVVALRHREMEIYPFKL